MRRLSLTLTAVALVAAAQAQEAPKYTLRFKPAAGQALTAKLSGMLLDVALQNQSLGLQGDVSSTYESLVTAQDTTKKTTTVRLTLSTVSANLNGQTTTPQAPQPVSLVVDERGAVQGLEGDQQQRMGFLETGGVPLLLVAMLAHTVRFSADPVAVAEEWELSEKYLIPGMGEIPINTRWQLKEMKDEIATIVSTAAAALPDFKAPNPMAPGTEMDVRSGKAYITELTQEYDTKTSQLKLSEGKLKIEAQLNMQGMAVPVSMSMSFTLEPVAKAAEPAK